MSVERKRDIARQEQIARQQGRSYYPYIFVRDALAALLLFLILVALSAFVGVTPQAPADPTDSSYVPHPEWFFLFFYEIVKYFPGSLATVAVVGLPGLVFGGLLLLPWIDRGPERHPRKRASVMALMTFGWFIILGFSALAFISAPPVLEAAVAIPGVNVSSQSIHPGQQVYIDNCGSCHGEYGEGGPNPARPGTTLPPISTQDFLATFTDDTLFNIVANGLPDRGMVGFSLRAGGPLDDRKIEQVVAYMRAWEANPPVVAPYVPPPITVPNGPALFTSVCAPCHGLYGEGGTAPTLTTVDFRDRFSPESWHEPTLLQSADDLSQHVWERMSVLTGSQMEAIMNYTFSLSGSEAPVVRGPSAEQGDVSRGAVIYADWCANCHGPEGKTLVGPNSIFIVDPAYLAEASDEHLIEAISAGYPAPYNMPAFREILSSQEISDLLAWNRSFAP